MERACAGRVEDEFTALFADVRPQVLETAAEFEDDDRQCECAIGIQRAELDVVSTEAAGTFAIEVQAGFALVLTPS